LHLSHDIAGAVDTFRAKLPQAHGLGAGQPTTHHALNINDGALLVLAHCSCFVTAHKSLKVFGSLVLLLSASTALSFFVLASQHHLITRNTPTRMVTQGKVSPQMIPPRLPLSTHSTARTLRRRAAFFFFLMSDRTECPFKAAWTRAAASFCRLRCLATFLALWPRATRCSCTDAAFFASSALRV